MAVSRLTGFHFGHVAELGPGSSLGMGLLALLCGAKKYTALDVVPHASLETNEAVLDDLVRLLETDAPIPTQDEFPRVIPRLDTIHVPSEILLLLGAPPVDELLCRVEQLRFSLRHPEHGDSLIEYRVPWQDEHLIRPHNIDFLFSQAVLEHVNDVAATYRACSLWLRANCVMSHAIDFDSHGLASTWDGHWHYGDLTWRLVRGRREYLINRLPLAGHTSELLQAHFEVVSLERSECEPTFTDKRLAPRFRGMSIPDRRTKAAFVVARRIS
jgi:hypothetical protein